MVEEHTGCEVDVGVRILGLFFVFSNQKTKNKNQMGMIGKLKLMAWNDRMGLSLTFPCAFNTSGAILDVPSTSRYNGSSTILGLEAAKSIKAAKRGSGFRRTACPNPGTTFPLLRVDQI